MSADSNDETSDSRDELEERALFRISKNLDSTKGSLASTWRLLTEAAVDVLKVQRSSAWLLEENDTVLRCQCLYTAADRSHSEEPVVLTSRDYPSYFLALANGRGIDAGRAREDHRTCEFTGGYLEPLNIFSMLDSSIRVSGRIVGVLCNETVGEVRDWDADDIMFSADLANQAAIALLNKERFGALESLREANEKLELRVIELTEPLRSANQELEDQIKKRDELTSQLQSKHSELQDFLDNASDLIQQVDEAGRLVYVNRAWTNTMGYSLEQAKQLSFTDIVVPADLDHCQETFLRLSEGQDVGRIKVSFLTRGGEEIPVEGSVSVRRDPDGRFVTRGIFRVILAD